MFNVGIQGMGDATRWVFLVLWMAGATWIYWRGIRNKKVSVDDDNLYVSNYIKEVSIPLSEIREISENIWLNPHLITIHLKSSSDFGDKIYFIAKRISFGNPWKSSPVVRELIKLVRAKGCGINNP